MFNFDAALPALAGFEAALVPGQIATRPVAGECWIAGFLIGDMPCFFIGGPSIVDYRIFATAEAALGAIAHWLGLQENDADYTELRDQIKLFRPNQRDFGGGWHILRLVGDIGRNMFFVLNQSGPREEIYSDDSIADNAAYDAAAADAGYR